MRGAGGRARLALAGSVVVVSGASSGIGRSCALALVARGAHVVATGRDAGALEALGAGVTPGGGASLTTVVADLADPAAPGRVVDAALARHGRLDALVAAAGVGHLGPVVATDPARLGEVVDVDVRATLVLTAAAVRALLDPARGGAPGAVVLLGSIAGAVGVPGESVYSAAKAAVHAFADVLREELRGTGTTVSLVVPGVVDTAFFERRGAAYDRRVPRPVTPERVARAVLAALEGGRAVTVVPAWLAVPARLAGAAPRTYRALARRLS